MIINHIKTNNTLHSLLGPYMEVGEKRVVLAETPFVTIQGEGPNIGKNTLFIRFFGCNLANSCGVKWCDSGHSFITNKELSKPQLDKPDIISFSNVEEMYEQIFEINNLAEFNNVVFTGGEPLLWQYQIAELISLLQNRYKKTITLEIETNGTVEIESDLLEWFSMVHFNISPKIHVCSSFILLHQLLGGVHVGGINGKAKFEHDDWIVKFVAENTTKSFKLIEECIKKYNIKKEKIYLMAEGVTRQEQNEKMQNIAEYCIKNGYNFSARLHVLIWDLAKGI